MSRIVFLLQAIFLFSNIAWCDSAIAPTVNAKEALLSEVFRGNPESFADEIAPDFELCDEKGVLRKLSSFRGSWCVMCFLLKTFGIENVIQARYLKEVYPWLRSKNVKIVCVCDDTPARLADFKRRLELPFVFLSDTLYSAMGRYGVYTGLEETHATMIINPYGVVEKVIMAFDGGPHVMHILMFFTKMDSQGRL